MILPSNLITINDHHEKEILTHLNELHTRFAHRTGRHNNMNKYMMDRRPYAYVQ